MDSVTSSLSSLTTGSVPEHIVEEIDGQPAEWTSVLPLLEAASDEMTIGDLLAGKSFDLQDAMSAIEIMDPQMDSGMQKERPKDEPTSPPPPPAEDMPAALVIALLDEVMCAEHGWYSGLTLAQTLWRLEWMQNAHEIGHLPLRATLIATARAVAATHGIVLRGDVHEEEDFASSLSGLHLHDDVTDAELIGMLNASEEACSEAVSVAKAAKAEAEAAASEFAGAGAAAADSSAGGVAASLGEELALAEAVLCRVRFRRGYCGALIQLARPNAKTVEVAKRMLAFAEAQMEGIITSTHLGTPREELAYCLGGITLRLRLGTSPKRAEWLSRADGAKARAELLGELKVICSVGECVEYDGFVRWLQDLCGSARPVPSILTRSAAQLVGVSEDRNSAGLRAPMTALLPAAVALYSGLSEQCLAELLPLPAVAEFMGQLSQGELSRLRLLDVNRGRSRRRLRHYLADWAPLQDLAENLDADLQRAGYLEPGIGPFGAWVLQRTFGDMTRFVQLGFELELYAPCELVGIYWYLDIIMGMQLQLQKEVTDKAHLHHTALTTALKEAAAKEASGGGKKGKKAAKEKEKKVPKPPVVGSYATHLELLFARAQAELCRGTCLLLAALGRLGFNPPYDSEFMPLPRRFERRFAPFAMLVRPPPLGAAHFEQAQAQIEASPLENLLSTATGHFKSAKARLDGPIKAEARTDGTGLTPFQKSEAMAYAKVAVANNVLIASLTLRPPAAGSLTKFAFDKHPHYCTLSLEPPKAAKAAATEAAAAETKAA